MKKVFLFLFVMTVASLAEAQQNANVDQHAVEQTVINLFDALSNRDSILLKANCTPDILLFENGQVWNLDTMMRIVISLKKMDDYKRINKIEFIHTEIHNDVAWVTYHNQADITVNGKHRVVKWVETVVLINEKNKWKIKILHSTPDKLF